MTVRICRAATLLSATLACLAACTTTPPPSTPAEAEVLAPNANLLLQGIPPVPLPLVRQVEPYTDFRGHGFVDWHPQRREMIVAHRLKGASTVQLFRLAAPMGEPQPLTNAADPVTSATYEPNHGRYIVYERGAGGNEATQLYRLDLDTRAETLLTDPDQRHETGAWLHRESKLVVASVPLDRTAQGGTRQRIDTTLWLLDPMQPQGKRKLAELPGTGWFTGPVSWDDAQLSVVRYVSANESEVWTVDLATGARRQLLPAPGGARATHYAGPFSRDGRAMFVVSDRAGEFNELMRYDLASGEIRRVTAHVPWNVEDAVLSEDGRRLAVRVNVDGRDELRLFDAGTLAELPVPALPPGSVTRTGFHRGSHELAFAVDNARGPGELHSLDPATGRVQRWTRAAVPEGIDPDRFGEQQVVRWKSFDGRTISGWLTRPPARFTGRRPVLVSIHGGPEAQAKAGFMYRQNHFVQDLGIAVIQPNVRGSEGYGKTFLTLDNGMKREDAVKDIGTLLDWIAADPGLDPTRVVVSGGSYGGYMSLAVAATYPGRIAGAIDVVGISHFVTFLQNTESYRRDLRRVEYGDERDAAMRDYLDRISPLTNAQRITRPLLVAQGRNDPRVPYTEAEQIVAKVRANGTPVWYLRAENEGHGFARKENADYFFYATILFLRDTMKLP